MKKDLADSRRTARTIPLILSVVKIRLRVVFEFELGTHLDPEKDFSLRSK